MTAPLPGGPTPMVVEIGLKEIYDLLVALNTHVTVLSSDLKDLSKQGDDHETRLRAMEAAPKTTELAARVAALERRIWPLPSLAAITALAAIVLAAIPLVR